MICTMTASGVTLKLRTTASVMSFTSAFLLNGAAFDRMDVDFWHWRAPRKCRGPSIASNGPRPHHGTHPYRRPEGPSPVRPCSVAQIGYW